MGTLSATNAFASEMPAGHPSRLRDIGEFTISRGEGNTDGSLTVFYMLDPSSTAEKVDDYEEDLAPTMAPFGGYHYGQVTIPDRKSSVRITVTPVNEANQEQALSEWDETVQLVLLGMNPADATTPVNYAIASPERATVTILDDDGVSGFLNRNVDTESTGETARRGTGALIAPGKRACPPFSGEDLRARLAEQVGLLPG